MNLIECTNLNTNFVCLCFKVLNEGVSSLEWLVSPQYWHFILSDSTVHSRGTDSQARTLVRLAYKSYQMCLPFLKTSLSLFSVEVFASHKRKVNEMERDWAEYQFSDFKLKVKSRKSFTFIRRRSECKCGRKANIQCKILQCSKCCRSQECKVH